MFELKYKFQRIIHGKKGSQMKRRDYFSSSVRWLVTIVVSLAGLIVSITPVAGKTLAVEFAREWERSTKHEVFSSPAVGRGLVIFGTEHLSSGRVIAAEARTGRVAWEYQTGEMVRSSPAIAGDSVFVGSEDQTGGWDENSGTLHALNLADGSLAWKEDFNSLAFASPYIRGDRVYYVADDLFAFDRTTGDTRWRFDAPGDFNSSPVVKDGIVYCGTSDPSYVFAIDGTSGALKWKTEVDYFIEASPAVYRGVVYIGDWDQRFYALDARTGKILWQNKYGDRMTPAGVFTSALGWNGKIYYANSHGKVQGVAAKTGKHHWQHNYNNSWISSPALANNLLFWSNSGNRGPGGPPGYLYAFDPSSGDQLGETEVGLNVHSTPAVKNGKIYLGSNEKKGGALHVFKYWLRRLEKNGR